MAKPRPFSLKKLEALCDKETLEFFRDFYRAAPDKYRTGLDYYRQIIVGFRDIYPDDPEKARGAAEEYVNGLKRLRDLLAAIHTQPEPRKAWRDVLAVCRRYAPTAPWSRLPFPNIERDIKAARGWLAEQLREMRDATGICLILDTLNMRGGRGHNVAIEGTPECDPLKNSQDWLNGNMAYGNDYLIRGLHEMHREYSKKAWRKDDAFGFADYALFLCYSGIIMGHALRRLERRGTLLAVWGFHDGDLFLLGRKKRASFTFLCA